MAHTPQYCSNCTQNGTRTLIPEHATACTVCNRHVDYKTGALMCPGIIEIPKGRNGKAARKPCGFNLNGNEPFCPKCKNPKPHAPAVNLPPPPAPPSTHYDYKMPDSGVPGIPFLSVLCQVPIGYDLCRSCLKNSTYTTFTVIPKGQDSCDDCKREAVRFAEEAKDTCNCLECGTSISFSGYMAGDPCPICNTRKP